MVKGENVASHEAGKATVQVRLRGGLGNQLFGFLAGAEVASRTGAPLHLITKTLRTTGSTARDFVLEPLLTSAVSFGENSWRSKIFRESGFEFDKRFELLTAPVLLDGYFQSSRYFPNSSRYLRNRILDFSSSSPISEAIEAFIGVQVRRGDYLKAAQRSFHGIVPDIFFRESLAVLRSLVGNLPALVFSDDFGAAKELAKILPNSLPHQPKPEEHPLETLSILGRASALAISNSSFGWWAGFLSADEAPVIAPRPWFAWRSIDTNDLLEPSWLTMGFGDSPPTPEFRCGHD